MELILIACLAAFSKYLILWRILGIRTLVYFEKPFDILFTVLVPLLLLGTFSGAVMAAISGLTFSVLLLVTRKFVKPLEPKWITSVRGLLRWNRGSKPTR